MLNPPQNITQHKIALAKFSFEVVQLFPYSSWALCTLEPVMQLLYYFYESANIS